MAKHLPNSKAADPISKVLPDLGAQQSLSYWSNQSDLEAILQKAVSPGKRGREVRARKLPVEFGNAPAFHLIIVQEAKD